MSFLIEIPRVALFIKPNKSDLNLETKLKNSDCSIRPVTTAKEILSFIKDESSRFDVCVIPLTLFDLNTASKLCAEIKKIPELLTTPLVAFSRETKPEDNSKIYDLGFDLVCSYETHGYEFKQLISTFNRAILNERRAQSAKVHAAYKTNALQKVFELLDFPFLIFDNDFQCSYLNQSAIDILKISENNAKSILDQFIGLLKEHSNRVLRHSKITISKFAINLEKGSGVKTNANIRVISLIDTKSTYCGYVIYIDKTALQDNFNNLSDLLSKTSLLGIKALASHYPILKSTQGKIDQASLRFEQLCSKAVNKASLNDALAVIVLMLDDLMTPSITLNLNFLNYEMLAITEANLFQVLLLILLFSAGCAGEGGEISMSSSSVGEHLRIEVKILSKTKLVDFSTVNYETSLFLKEASKLLNNNGSSFEIKGKGEFEYELAFALVKA